MIQCCIYYSQYVAVSSHQSKLEQKLKPPSNIEVFHLQYIVLLLCLMFQMSHYHPNSHPISILQEVHCLLFTMKTMKRICDNILKLHDCTWGIFFIVLLK